MYLTVRCQLNHDVDRRWSAERHRNFPDYSLQLVRTHRVTSRQCSAPWIIGSPSCRDTERAQGIDRGDSQAGCQARYAGGLGATLGPRQYPLKANIDSACVHDADRLASRLVLVDDPTHCSASPLRNPGQSLSTPHPLMGSPSTPVHRPMLRRTSPRTISSRNRSRRVSLQRPGHPELGCKRRSTGSGRGRRNT